MKTQVLLLGLVSTVCEGMPSPRSFWPGWEAMSDIFVFGDSYTTTGFNASTGPQPNPANPLGNPEYPGHTSSNGPNWIDYLTVKYNKTLLLTYNLAYGGATIDAQLAVPYLPTVLSLQDQVQQEFLPMYLGTNWTPTSTLFVFWFGINDVGNTYASNQPGDYDIVYQEIIDQYALQVQDLYMAGARNFLFLNVPPVHQSPLTIQAGSNFSTLEFSAIANFNDLLSNMAEQLRQNSTAAGEPAHVLEFDTYNLFSKVLDDPKAFPETADYANTTDYCFAYENGTESMTTFNSSCVAPVNQYFWLNSLHPTYPVHDLLAKEVAKLLM